MRKQNGQIKSVIKHLRTNFISLDAFLKKEIGIINIRYQIIVRHNDLQNQASMKNKAVTFYQVGLPALTNWYSLS